MEITSNKLSGKTPVQGAVRRKCSNNHALHTEFWIDEQQSHSAW